MKVHEIQAVYYSLKRFFTHEQAQNKKFELIISYKGQLITGDFLFLSDNLHLIKYTINEAGRLTTKKYYEDDKRDKTFIENCSDNFIYSFSHHELLIGNFLRFPEILLQRILDIIKECECKLFDEFPKIIKNVKFLNSSLELDYLQLNDEDYEIVSLRIINLNED